MFICTGILHKTYKKGDILPPSLVDFIKPDAILCHSLKEESESFLSVNLYSHSNQNLLIGKSYNIMLRQTIVKFWITYQACYT